MRAIMEYGANYALRILFEPLVTGLQIGRNAQSIDLGIVSLKTIMDSQSK